LQFLYSEIFRKYKKNFKKKKTYCGGKNAMMMQINPKHIPYMHVDEMLNKQPPTKKESTTRVLTKTTTF
jgi:hypothetical protein